MIGDIESPDIGGLFIIMESGGDGDGICWLRQAEARLAIGWINSWIWLSNSKLDPIWFPCGSSWGSAKKTFSPVWVFISVPLAVVLFCLLKYFLSSIINITRITSFSLCFSKRPEITICSTSVNPVSGSNSGGVGDDGGCGDVLSNGIAVTIVLRQRRPNMRDFMTPIER